MGRAAVTAVLLVAAACSREAPLVSRAPGAPRSVVLRNVRVFDAPRDLVWKAFTESERLMQWWGPKGFTMLVAKLDLRPGGVFHYSMRSPDGRAMYYYPLSSLRAETISR